MIRTAILLLVLLPQAAAAQTCFDPAQCARDAITTSRMLSREVSALASDLRSLRADRNALSSDVAVLREEVAKLKATQAKQAERLKAVEAENNRLREALGLPEATPPE